MTNYYAETVEKSRELALMRLSFSRVRDAVAFGLRL